MADETGHHDENNVDQPDTGAAANGGEGAPAEGFASPLEFLDAELKKVEAEKAELQDRLLRLAAEMENLRKRTARDVADAREYSIAAFAREMLAVSDNLGRAIAALAPETRETADGNLKALIEGVELTARMMLQGLEKQGVKRISPLGEKFNANFHQAMFEIPDAEQPANTVLQVVQDGYVIGERMLRPALVGVAKGGPKAAAQTEKAGADSAK